MDPATRDRLPRPAAGEPGQVFADGTSRHHPDLRCRRRVMVRRRSALLTTLETLPLTSVKHY
jgi:hypothetical protein